MEHTLKKYYISTWNVFIYIEAIFLKYVTAHLKYTIIVS